jgi:MFS family permease
MKKLRPIFLASFFFSIHTAFLAYINSSMLGQFGSESMVSAIYTIASALSLLLVFSSAHIVRKLGVVRLSIMALITSAFLLLLLGSATTAKYVIVPIFMLYFSLNSIIYYVFDLFIEHYSAEHNTGNVRGLYLTLNNAGWVVSPIVVGYLTSVHGFGMAYVVAACAVLCCFVVILASQHKFKDRPYKKEKLSTVFAALRKNHVLRRIISINFVLNFFFVWMVIYTPLYLSSVIGFDWKTIGILFSIMLLPFVLFQYASGKIADHLGEKWLIVVGLFIMGVATLLFPYLGAGSFISYALVLFLTRVGASIVEVCSDSYFFKHVTDQDTTVISVYRNMSPVAYIIGPMLGALVLALTTYTTLFLGLAIILFAATLYTFRLRN